MAARNRPQLWQTEPKRLANVRRDQERWPRQDSDEYEPDGRNVLGLFFFRLLVGLLDGALERTAEDVAERRARIGGAVLGDRLLLLRHFERLDRHLHLAGAPIELG